MLSKTSFMYLSKMTDRPIILFGSGNIAQKTIRKLKRETISHIVDNSTNLHGTEYEGLQVKSPTTVSDSYLVILCSTAISDISSQLSHMGLRADVDFVLSPVLNDLLAITELEELSKVIYFTSGTVANSQPNAGGGLYCCRVDGVDVSLERLYSGPCYGMIRQNEALLFVDTDQGLFRYDLIKKTIEKMADLPHGSRAHGISYNEANDCYYISCSDLDQVLEFDHDFKQQRSFKLSNKFEQHNQAMHHCNDNLALGSSLYVSMFSSTGNWKNDCFDGCIAEFDLKSGVRLSDIATGLYMPHNIKYFNGSLHILDSLPGHLRFSNFAVQGTFPAFTRGLSYSKGLYYIGQSKNRNYSKVMGLSNNISIDCGIIVFNAEMKASRFVQLPYVIGEIHSVVAIDGA